jgi:hypothetical protein
MKSVMIVVLVGGLTLVSGVSAMEMMDSGAMMKKDTMVTGSMNPHSDGLILKDTMMKDDKMMMAKDYARMSTASLAKSRGYNWSKDRAMLATQASITGYSGTMKQNLMIRTYLMGMMKDDKMKMPK